MMKEAKDVTDIQNTNDSVLSVNALLSTTDATVWADEWLKTLSKHPKISKDRSVMIGWFANAIMTGYDAGRKAEAALSKKGDDEKADSN